MKEMTILNSDIVDAALETLARRNNTTKQQLASVILADAVLSAEAQPISVHDEASGRFSVSDRFAGYPFASIAFAQRFVDEATKLPGVVARRQGRGVSFDPLFATIDYLVSVRGKPGIVVSFYGGADDFDDPQKELSPGRKSYRTGRIHNAEQLEYFLPFLRQSFERRYGQIGEAAK